MEEQDHSSLSAAWERLEAFLQQEDLAPWCGGSERWGVPVSEARDRAVQVLRCLRVWYDLPSPTIVEALHIMDSFISKVKVQAKHVPCIALSALRLSWRRSGLGTSPPRAGELIALSQTRCSEGDLARMESRVAAKVGERAESPWAALEACHALHRHVALASGVSPAFSLDLAAHRLELAMACHAVTQYKGSVLVLGLMRYLLDPNTKVWAPFLDHLTTYCQAIPLEVQRCAAFVAGMIMRYELQRRLPRHLRQPLSWRLSHRTLKLMLGRCGGIGSLPAVAELQPQQAEEVMLQG